MSQINDLPLHSIQGMPDGQRIAFVQAQWHADIVHQARDAFLAELERQGIPADTIDVFDVPGAFEIPLHAKRLAQSGRYAAIVGCALVVDGGIYRHDFVAQAVVSGLMQAGLETGVPVLSVSLTPHHYQDSAHHRAIFEAHFVQKGREAAEAALRIAATHAAL